MAEISRKTFDDATMKTRMGILFDLTSDIAKNLKEHPVECNKRFVKIEKRKWFNTSVAAISGVVGGFIAVVGKKYFGG